MAEKRAWESRHPSHTNRRRANRQGFFQVILNRFGTGGTGSSHAPYRSGRPARSREHPHRCAWRRRYYRNARLDLGLRPSSNRPLHRGKGPIWRCQPTKGRAGVFDLKGIALPWRAFTWGRLIWQILTPPHLCYPFNEKVKAGTGFGTPQELAVEFWRQVKMFQDGVSENVFFRTRDSVLGVTGLARSGKTCSITLACGDLLDRGQCRGFLAAPKARIEGCVPCNPSPTIRGRGSSNENHLAALTRPTPHWPEAPAPYQNCACPWRVRPMACWAGFSGGRVTVHLDIVDYPGEWTCWIWR